MRSISTRFFGAILIAVGALLTSCGGGGGGNGGGAFEGTGSPGPGMSTTPDLPITNRSFKSGGALDLSTVPSIDLRSDVVQFAPEAQEAAGATTKGATAMQAPGGPTPVTLPVSVILPNSVLLPLYVTPISGNLNLLRQGKVAYSRRVTIEPHAITSASGEMFRAFVEGALAATNEEVRLAETQILPGDDDVWTEAQEQIRFVQNIVAQLQSGKTLTLGEDEVGAVSIDPSTLGYLDQAVMAMLAGVAALDAQTTAPTSTKVRKLTSLLEVLIPSANAQYSSASCSRPQSPEDRAFCMASVTSARLEHNFARVMMMYETLKVLQALPGWGLAIGHVINGATVIMASASIAANRYRFNQTQGATCQTQTEALNKVLNDFLFVQNVGRAFDSMVIKPYKLIPEGEALGFGKFALFVGKKAFWKYFDNLKLRLPEDLCAPKATKIHITPAGLTLAVGQSGALKAEVMDAYGSKLRAPNDLTWNSHQASIASVSPAGVVSTGSIGTAYITASSVSLALVSPNAPVRVCGVLPCRDDDGFPEPVVPPHLELMREIPPPCAGSPDEPWGWNPQAAGSTLDAAMTQRIKAFDVRNGHCARTRWYCAIGNQVCRAWVAASP